MIDPGAPNGTVVTNTGTVHWNTRPQTASASVSVTVGGDARASACSAAAAWHDVNFDDAPTGEDPLAGWTVELMRNGVGALVAW